MDYQTDRENDFSVMGTQLAIAIASLAGICLLLALTVIFIHYAARFRKHRKEKKAFKELAKLEDVERINSNDSMESRG